jgi:plastocyanin
MFDLGYDSIEVTDALGIKEATAVTYFRQWRRYPPLFRTRYALAKECFRRVSRRERKALAAFLASELRTSRQRVLECMSKPWAIKQLASGEWRRWPVEERHGAAGGTIRRGLQLIGRSTASRHLKLLLELAMDQDYSPLDDFGQEPELIADEDWFFPRTITVRAGADISLTFRNEDTVRHNLSVYRTRHAKHAIFRGESVGIGASTYRFIAPETPGKYFYCCDDHADTMHGELIVTRPRRFPRRQVPPRTEKSLTASGR